MTMASVKALVARGQEESLSRALQRYRREYAQYGEPELLSRRQKVEAVILVKKRLLGEPQDGATGQTRPMYDLQLVEAEHKAIVERLSALEAAALPV